MGGVPRRTQSDVKARPRRWDLRLGSSPFSAAQTAPDRPDSSRIRATVWTPKSFLGS